jgi:predicted metal-dependent hydrolase
VTDSRHVPAAGDLPAYDIVVSPRARRVRLRMLPGAPVRVTIPRRFPMREVAGIVREALPWIERTRQRVERAHEVELARRAAPIPASIHLAALELTLPVVLRASDATGVRVRESAGRVVVSGAVDDEAAVREALRRWVHRTAKGWLPGWLHELGEEHGLTYAAVRVRRQRSRWGSCSSSGTISLNVDLVFLPPDLARYVLVHELAHTRRMDHSPAFWELLERLEPGARAQARRLRAEGREHVPGWALPPLDGGPAGD